MATLNAPKPRMGEIWHREVNGMVEEAAIVNIEYDKAGTMWQGGLFSRNQAGFVPIGNGATAYPADAFHPKEGWELLPEAGTFAPKGWVYSYLHGRVVPSGKLVGNLDLPKPMDIEGYEDWKARIVKNPAARSIVAWSAFETFLKNTWKGWRGDETKALVSSTPGFQPAA